MSLLYVFDKFGSPKFSDKILRQNRRRKFLYGRLLPFLCRPLDTVRGNIIVFAPHQDDETFGCGGLIALKRSQGIEVTVVFLTDGSRSHGDLPAPQRAELVSQRRQEALSALGVLGVPPKSIHFLGYPDGELSTLSSSNISTLQEKLRDLIRMSGAVSVFVPHRRDSHLDHEAAFRFVRDTVREFEGAETSLLLYEYPVWLIWSRNRLFSNLKWSDLRNAQSLSIEVVLSQKSEAITKYQTQLATLPPGFTEQFLTGQEIFFCRENQTERRI